MAVDIYECLDCEHRIEISYESIPIKLPESCPKCNIKDVIWVLVDEK